MSYCSNKHKQQKPWFFSSLGFELISYHLLGPPWVRVTIRARSGYVRLDKCRIGLVRLGYVRLGSNPKSNPKCTPKCNPKSNPKCN